MLSCSGVSGYDVRRDDQQPIVAGPDDGQHPEQVAGMADDRAAPSLETREAEPVARTCNRPHPPTELAAQQPTEESVEVRRSRNNRTCGPGRPCGTEARVAEAAGGDPVVR